jgi:hypothetical protein
MANKMNKEENPGKVTDSLPTPAHPAAVQGSDSGRAQGETAGETEEEIKRSALNILTTAFSRPAEVLKVVCNFLTFMQPYWLLAFLTGSASLVPQNSFIRARPLALAV